MTSCEECGVDNHESFVYLHYSNGHFSSFPFCCPEHRDSWLKRIDRLPNTGISVTGVRRGCDGCRDLAGV